MDDQIQTDEGKHLEIVEEEQDFSTPETVAELPFKAGDKLVHTESYIRNVLRGNYREKARNMVYECTDCSSRSVTVRPWGSQDKYGPQFPLRYMRKADEAPSA
jgi:hypothetical protein